MDEDIFQVPIVSTEEREITDDDELMDQVSEELQLEKEPSNRGRCVIVA